MRQNIVHTILFLALPLLVNGQMSYSDITSQSNLMFNGTNYGAAVGDYNADGFDDLFVMSQNQACRLYLNNGNGTFSNVAEAAGVDYTGTPTAAGWLDVDNDGNLDLLVATRNENNVLYKSNGDGTFTDHTFLSGLLLGGKVRAMLFADINLDGLIDIYLARLNTDNIMYLNIGNSQFVNFTNLSGTNDTQISMGAVFFDYDNDGDPDLYLTHDADQPNILYQNDGKGYFTDVSAGSGANIGTNGMGVDVADIDHDGWLDIYVTNLSYNSLLHNNGDGTFTEIGSAAGVDDPGMGWGCTFIDVNNDGHQDLYAANDSNFAPLPNLLYLNNGDLTFDLISEGTALASMEPSYGVVELDFDNNGRQDLYIANYGGDKGNQLLRNDSQALGNWVKIKLQGTTSNRLAIGTRITLTVGELVITDELLGSSGYASQNSLTMHHGVGDREIIDELSIRWPNGLTEVFQNLPINTTYSFIEGEGSFTTAHSDVLSPALVSNVSPNPFNQHIQIELAANAATSYTLYNSTGKACRKEIHQTPLSNSAHLMHTGHLPAGLYFLLIRQGTQTQLIKMLKLNQR